MMAGGPQAGHGQGTESGYGVAAVGGAAAYGVRDRRSSDGQPGSSQGHSTLSPAAAAKQMESQMERQRLRMSQPYPQTSGPSGQQGGESASSPLDDGRRSSVPTASVYQHTDMGSAGDEEEGPSEIPPK